MKNHRHVYIKIIIILENTPTEAKKIQRKGDTCYGAQY